MRATKLETHSYIAAQVAELAKLAVGAGLTELAFLLSMAQLEADSQALAEKKRSRAA